MSRFHTPRDRSDRAPASRRWSCRRSGSIAPAAAAALPVLAAAIGLVACAATPALQSAPPEPAIAIDGAYDDWAGRFTAIEIDRNLGLSVANDRSQLYLCLVTRDIEIGGLLQREGFTLWFDPQAGRGRALGLRVGPVAVESGEVATPPLEVLFDGSEFGYQLADPTPDGPIDVRGAARADVVVYEIRLALDRPLVDGVSRREAVTLPRVDRLGLGLVAESPPFPELEGGRRGDRSGRPRHRIEPLRIWLTATLVDAS